MPYDARAFIARAHPEGAQGLRDLMALLPGNLKMVEVGIFAGESTRLFWGSGKLARLWTVDPWAGNYAEDGPTFCAPVPWQNVYDTYQAFAQEHAEIETLRMTSLDAAAYFAAGELDFVYLDGNHGYTAITADIAAWRPKVRAGGWLGGHDYHPQYPGVVRAVNEARLPNLRTFVDTSWLAWL